MSDLPTSETVSGPPRHRRESRFPGAWIGGALAVVLTLAAVALGLTHLRGTRSDRQASDAAETAPVTAPAATPLPSAGKVIPVVPAPTPRKTTAGAVTPSAAATPGGLPAAPAGFRLTWGDAFDGRSGTGLDRDVYRYDTGQGKFGTGE